MMTKYQKAEHLFASIGEIDDGLVSEALRYYPVKRRRAWIPILAACLSIALVISFTLSFTTAIPIISFLFGTMGDANQGAQPPLEEQTFDSLDSLMEAQKGSDSYVRYESAASLASFKDAGIIWQYEEGGDYYVKPITSTQLSKVQNLMESGEEVGESSPELSCRVWICDGKGNVRSPYLKNSAGNTDSAVFDYEAEIIPDEDFVECISDILN